MENNDSNESRCLFYELSILDISISSLFFQRESTSSAGNPTFRKRQYPSDARQFFPLSESDAQIQRFNITGSIPASLQDPEKVAMWFLETEYINRSKVFQYFSNLNDNKALLQISEMICKLEAAAGFVDGLKFFVPVVGCWESMYNKSVIDTNTDKVKAILAHYSEAHLMHSTTPIFNNKRDLGHKLLTECLGDLAFWLLHFVQSPTLHSNRRQHFYNEVSLIVRPLFYSTLSPDPNGDRSREMADFILSLYESLRVGRPLQPLPEPNNSPSFLLQRFGYHSSRPLDCKAIVSIGFRSIVTLVNSATILPYEYEHTMSNPNLFSTSSHPLLSCLTANALYLFSLDYLSGHGDSIDVTQSCKPPVACIPLENCNAQELIEIVNDPFLDEKQSLGTLQLCSNSAKCIPFIEFNQDNSSSWPVSAPTAITYHDCILLRLERSIGVQTESVMTDLHSVIDAVSTAIAFLDA